MPIEFAQFPTEWRQPLYWVEVDPSMAGLPTTRLPVLLVGQKLSTGKATVNIPIPIGTLAQAIDEAGEGSMLHAMFMAYYQNNFAQETWMLPVADPIGGQKAVGSIQVSAAPTDSGTIHLYIAGQHVPVNIAGDDTVSEVAVKIGAAINAMGSLPVSATSVSGDTAIVHLACKWSGDTGNDITLMDSWRGTLGAERLPTGLTLTYTAMASGSGQPVFDTAIANLSDEAYEYVAMPFNDGTSTDAWEAEYGFSDTGRWGWMRQQFGGVFSAYRDAYSDMIQWGATNNSGVISFMGIEEKMPSPVWEVSAAYAGKASRALTNDPGRPLQTLELTGIKGPRRHERFNDSERNSLAGKGIATQKVGPNNVPQIMRETTSYQLNTYGIGDDAYELVTTLATLSKLIRNQRQAITSKFPRHKLADDGTRFGLGQKIVTPKIIKAELVAQYRMDEFNGLVENAKKFKENLLVERDPNNPNRVNVLYPPDLINQLRIFAVLAQFRLQYDRGTDAEMDK